MQQRVKRGMSTLQQRHMRARVAPYEEKKKKKKKSNKEKEKQGVRALQNRHANACNAPERKKGKGKKGGILKHGVGVQLRHACCILL